MPDTAAPPDAAIAALRAEIDQLDDAMHDLLMRRAEVVARLAQSGAKGAGPALRAGREASILRRLLGRHRGALPRPALVRLWRELLAATTAMQGRLTIAAALDEAGTEVLRQHMGLATPILKQPDAKAAVNAAADGEAALAALPGEGLWWRGLPPGRLHVVARLPFFGTAPEPVYLLSRTEPDPSGHDRTLLRLEVGGPMAAEGTEAALAACGLAPTRVVVAGNRALAEVPGFLRPDDPRLAPLNATILGAFAVPIPA
jgi:chorismate mutase